MRTVAAQVHGGVASTHHGVPVDFGPRQMTGKVEEMVFGLGAGVFGLSGGVFGLSGGVVAQVCAVAAQVAAGGRPALPMESR